MKTTPKNSPLQLAAKNSQRALFRVASNHEPLSTYVFKLHTLPYSTKEFVGDGAGTLGDFFHR
jgi:hypothetical protein